VLQIRQQHTTQRLVFKLPAKTVMLEHLGKASERTETCDGRCTPKYLFERADACRVREAVANVNGILRSLHLELSRKARRSEGGAFDIEDGQILAFSYPVRLRRLRRRAQHRHSQLVSVFGYRRVLSPIVRMDDIDCGVVSEFELAHEQLEAAQHIGFSHHRKDPRVTRDIIDERHKVAES
jgi:hypothetical protein